MHRSKGGLRCFPAIRTRLPGHWPKAGEAAISPNSQQGIATPKRLLFDENQVLGRTLAVLTRLQFEFDPLPLRETRQTGTLNGGNMDECVL